MYETFGISNSVEEINMTAEGLKEEGDVESLNILAKENGLEDLVELYVSGITEQFADTLMAAVGRLNIEKEEEKIKQHGKILPVKPIVEYLQSRCEEEKIARAIRKNDKSLLNCIEAILPQTRKIIDSGERHIPDLTVFMMAIDYYLED